jgi:hypothetical protein
MKSNVMEHGAEAGPRAGREAAADGGPRIDAPRRSQTAPLRHDSRDTADLERFLAVCLDKRVIGLS